MLSPEEFRRAYPEAELRKELPDRPIASLRDIQYLYGTLYTLATTGGGTYAPYLTPDAAGDLIDEPDSLIVVRVDVSGDEPALAADGRGPVWVTKYTEELIPKVAHCKYPAARGIDHSVTHQAGKNSDPDKLARYAKERLSKWAANSVVQSSAEDHEDGWIIDALAELGENEDTIETLEREVRSNLSGSTTALLTVQVKLDADGPYLWPGDLDVAMAAMRSRKLSKLISKGKASNSAGEATDLITGARTRTVGTAQDPLNYFLGKQLEKFPGFDPDQAWRTHPISEDAAITLMNAETFIDACSYRTFGARVYYLPYFFGKPSVEDTYLLYGILYDTVMRDAEERGLTPIETVYQRREDDAIDDNKLRFYVSAVMPHQMSRFDVFGETMNGRIQYPASLAAAHRDALRTAAFKNDGERTAALPRDENWPLLSDGGLLGLVASGSYFYQTFSTGDDTDASADDPRIQALVSVLRGDSIPVSTLLESYVDRIIDDSGDDEYGFPFFRVASQYAQLCALATAEHDFLEAAGKQRPISEPPSYESRTMPKIEEPIADGGFAGAEKLESFIEDTPALATNDERCASFLLGALVGAVGSYQEYKHDRSTTLVDQFPVQAVTRNRIKKVTESAIEKTITYTRQEKKGNASYPGTKFDYIVDRLREAVIQPDPDDWEIDTADLRFYYALGLTYGMNDRPLGSSIESEQPNPTAN